MYLLGSSLAAALPAERRVLARRGWEGEKVAFLSILGECSLVVPLVRTIEVLVGNNSFSAAFSSRVGGLFGLPLRASNEHILSVRVAQAQEANRPPILFHP